MYDIKDILQKGIYISEKKRQLYLDILKNEKELKMIIIINTMIRGVNRDILNYRRLIASVGDIVESIDFDIYDMMASRINQFMRTIVAPEVHSIKELLEFSIGMEQAVYALLVDIQGRLVRNDQNVESSVTYLVLAEMILDKENTIRKLIKYLEQVLMEVK